MFNTDPLDPGVCLYRSYIIRLFVLRVEITKKEKHDEQILEAKQKTFPDIVSSLVYIYKSTDQYLEAETVLVDWIARFPNDSNAKNLLEEVRKPK